MRSQSILVKPLQPGKAGATERVWWVDPAVGEAEDAVSRKEQFDMEYTEDYGPGDDDG